MWDGWPATRPLIVSHRGLAPAVRHENTIASVEAAFASGADAVEVDVRLTSEGVPILHHDRTLAGLPVSQTPLDELQAQARGKGYELATVAELLETTASRGPVNLEIKDPDAAGPVLDLLEETGQPPAFVTGFHRQVVRDVNEAPVETPTGLILGPHRAYRLLFSRRRVRRLRSWVDEADPHVLVLDRRFLRLGLASRVFSLERPIVVWTVNRRRELTRTMGHPLIWGVITDRPTIAHRVRTLFDKLDPRRVGALGRGGIDEADRPWRPIPEASEGRA